MNIKIGGNKVNPFSVGNPVADLGDAIVGTYEYDYVRDDGGSGGNTGGNSDSSEDGYGWEDFKTDLRRAWEAFKVIEPFLPYLIP